MAQYLPYDLVRGLHIISFLAWMAAMLMLPRLFAYQMSAAPNGELDLKMREASTRLRKIILTPAMIATWIFGLILLSYITSGFSNWNLRAWLWAKLALVLVMTALHGYFAASGKRLAAGERPRSERFWRMINEAPFVVAVIMILLVTVEPLSPL
jgi:putative membrane protein